MEQRLGKTVVAILHIKRMMPKARLVLVVAPYSALDGWASLIEQLDISAKVWRLYGTAKERLCTLGNAVKSALYETEGACTNYCLFNKEGHLRFPDVKYTEWDCVVVDERCLSNPKSSITKFYTNNFRCVSMRMLLTGTPAPESELEYHQQLAYVDPQIFDGMNYYSFQYRCFKKSVDGHSFFLLTKGRDYIARRLAKYTFSLSRKEAGFDREKTYEVRKIQLPKKIRSAYKMIESELILELDGEEKARTVWSMTGWQWLRQLCGGCGIKAVAETDTDISLHKIDILRELLEGEYVNQQAIIWCNYVHEVNTIKKLFPDSVAVYGAVPKLEREELRQQFMRGAVQYFIAQPDAYKHGTDLSCTNLMVYYSTPVALDTRAQSEDRFVNLVKTGALHIIDLICQDTIEDDINKSLRLKERRIQAMSRAIAGIHARKDIYK
jgi:superfamily II DNA or RNA helicase